MGRQICRSTRPNGNLRIAVAATSDDDDPASAGASWRCEILFGCVRRDCEDSFRGFEGDNRFESWNGVAAIGRDDICRICLWASVGSQAVAGSESLFRGESKAYHNFGLESLNGSLPSLSDRFNFGRCPLGRAAPVSAFARSGKPDCCAPCTSLTQTRNRQSPPWHFSSYHGVKVRSLRSLLLDLRSRLHLDLPC